MTEDSDYPDPVPAGEGMVSVPKEQARRMAFDEHGGRVMRYMDTAYRSDMHEVVYDVAGRGNHRPS